MLRVIVPGTRRSGDLIMIRVQRLEVEGDGFLAQRAALGFRFGHGHTAGQVGNPCAEAIGTALDHDLVDGCHDRNVNELPRRPKRTPAVRLYTAGVRHPSTQRWRVRTYSDDSR